MVSGGSYQSSPMPWLPIALPATTSLVLLPLSQPLHTTLPLHNQAQPKHCLFKVPVSSPFLPHWLLPWIYDWESQTDAACGLGTG